MIELAFTGNGNAMSGPLGNDIGSIAFNQTGFFDYRVLAGGGTMPPYHSQVDQLFNGPLTQLMGQVDISQSAQVNGTQGIFYFYPGLSTGPAVDQVYVDNVGFYLDPPSAAHAASSVPETSTWIMLILGFAVLFLKTSKRHVLKPRQRARQLLA